MTILLYLIFIFGISCATFVLTSNNMVYSALALIGVFLSSAFILLMLKADFLGFLFVIVYVGAVSILFLFVIMNLSIKEDEFRHASLKYSNQNYQDKLLFVLFLSVLFILSFAIFTDPFLAPILSKKANFFTDCQVLG
jgi:NADH:ubiquinone oxidoreductase subunit 6 (subunit J)